MLDADQIATWSAQVPDWDLCDQGRAIERVINTKTFVKGVDWIQAIAHIAETEAHHPDLHLTGYRHLRIVVTTHAIGGLSENDFILAAKIDAVLAAQ